MRPIYLLLGCAVFLGAATVCAAADVNGADNAATGATHMTGDNNSHDLAPASDDGATPLHSHDTASSSSSGNHASGSNNSATNSDDSPVHFGDRSSALPARRENLGWQSLLPGSIQ